MQNQLQVVFNCYSHLPKEQAADYIFLEENMEFSRRFYCHECFSEKNFGDPNCSLHAINLSIQNELKKIYDKQKVPKQIEELKNNLSIRVDLLKDFITNQINSASEKIKQCIKFIEEQMPDKSNSSHILDYIIKNYKSEKSKFPVENLVRKYFNQKEDEQDFEMQKIELNLAKKLKPLLEQQIEKISDAVNYLAGLENKIIQKINLMQRRNQFQIIRVDCKQEEKIVCKNIIFNYDATILAASCENLIKLWRFEDGRIREKINTLNGHFKLIMCMIFSKKKNWLISSDLDQKLLLWKAIRSDWQKFETNMNTHYTNCFCLVLNQEENQLICGCQNGKIIVYGLNYEQNKLSEEYTFLFHTDCIFSLAFNEQFTILASCGRDKQIIFWKKYNHFFPNKVKIYTNSDYGIHVRFLKNDLLACMYFSDGSIHLFNIEKNGGVQQIFNQETQNEKYSPFPQISMNGGGYMLIKALAKHIYFSFLKPDDTIESKPEYIEGENLNIHGGYTEKGNHLVLWNAENKQFSSYKLQIW